MRTYAEYLATMTVKTLNALAKEMGLKGYSKLRKVALVEVIARQVGMDEIAGHKENVVILDTDNPADHDTIAALIAQFAVPATREITDGRHLELINLGMGYVPTEAALSTDPFARALRASLQPAESVSEALEIQTPTETTNDDETPSLSDLKAAYRNLRTTINRMGGRGAEGKRRIKYVGKLRNLSAQLKTFGITHPQYL